MKLLSNDGDRIVFALSQREVETLRHLVRVGHTAERKPVRLSHHPESLPPSALEDFNAARLEQQRTHREFLERLFSPESTQLNPPAPGRKGYGLTLDRPDLERLLQSLNELKLAHWEKLGCPEFGTSDESEIDPANFPSMWLMDAVNELQMLFLRALAARD